jgi:hypothetical protein
MASEILDTTKVTVDGFEYTLQALDTVKARKVLFKVMGALAPVLQALAKAQSEPEQALAQAASALVEHLPESAYAELCDVFAANTIVELPDGRSPQLKDVLRFHFSRRLSAEARWLFECCKFNFADFLDGKALGDLRALMPKASLKSTAPLSSTGSSPA